MYSPALEWDGFKINGKIFRSAEVAILCRDFGQAHVFEACTELDLTPSQENIEQLRNKCQEWEDKLL